MTAFHSNWTKPFFARNGGAPYFIEDYDLLTTILSALEWRRYNGGIKMITDDTGAAYYEKLGLTHLWDLGVDAALETAVDASIAPGVFWAAGKIYALRNQNAPCVMLDTDFMVWRPLAGALSGTSLAVIHREEISAAIYPQRAFFEMKSGWNFPENWDWSVLPGNTALLYIADESFKDYYTAQSISFMKALRKSKDTTAEMVFAEQRLLAMCANAKGVNIKSLLDVHNLERQTSFTHVWGLKAQFQEAPEKRA